MPSRPSLLASSLAAVIGLTALPAYAEPLTTAGIGLASCAQLVRDMDPGQGFNNPVNVMVYYWTQGYMSAANIHLLEEDGEYVDLGALTEKDVLAAVFSYCREHPKGKPISAIDQLIRRSVKLSGDWESGTIKWND